MTTMRWRLMRRKLLRRGGVLPHQEVVEVGLIDEMVEGEVEEVEEEADSEAEVEAEGEVDSVAGEEADQVEEEEVDLAQEEAVDSVDEEEVEVDPLTADEIPEWIDREAQRVGQREMVE